MTEPIPSASLTFLADWVGLFRSNAPIPKHDQHVLGLVETALRTVRMPDETTSTPRPELYFDADTLAKVDRALAMASIPKPQRTDAINMMQNEGILFREWPADEG